MSGEMQLVEERDQQMLSHRQFIFFFFLAHSAVLKVASNYILCFLVVVCLVDIYFHSTVVVAPLCRVAFNTPGYLFMERP